MARNPVMLTALAVVHWNERRLPEQRADLYASIIRWLARSREQKPGREKAERSVVLLQELALRMQNHPQGMKTQVPKRWAAEQLAAEWGAGKVDKDSIPTAEAFLDAEELDSGIVVGRGSDVQFWHRTFQEFLAARAIAARPDAEQNQAAVGPAREGLPAGVARSHAAPGRRSAPAGPGQGGQPGADGAEAPGAEGETGRQGPLRRAAGRRSCCDLGPAGYQPPGRQYRELLRQ